MLPVSKIKLGGKDITTTWIRTNEPTKFTPYFQVYGIVFNKKSEILIIQDKNKWKIPGGTPENNETAEETLKRELLEEADVTVSKIIPLGVQKVEYPDNPNQDEGDLFYQYRYVCLLDKLLPQTPDPDNGLIYPRKFVPADQINEYVQWGDCGKAMFEDAVDVFSSL